jgi:AcrR family transcriptional regulator
MPSSLPEALRAVPVGRHRLPREVMEERQRARIAGPAISVFARRGYHATTVDDIVPAAKTSVGSFYSLFKGKEDCFLRAYATVIAEARQALAASHPAEAPWPGQVLAGLRTLLGLIAADPDRARVALVEAQAAGPTALRLYEQTLSEVTAFLAKGRVLASKSRKLPDSLEQTTAGGMAWLIEHRLVHGQGPEVEGLFAQLAELVLEPYLGEKRARRLIGGAA